MRSAWVAWLVAASTLAWSASAQGGDCGLGDTVSSETTIEGCTQGFDDITISKGGKLTVVGATLQGDLDVEVEGMLVLQDAVLSGTVSVGGKITIDATTVTAADGILRIHLLPGSSGLLRDATLAGHEDLRLGSADVIVDNVTLRDAGTAVSIEGTSVFLDEVAISGAQTALRVGEGATAHVTNSSLDAVTAVLASAGTEVTLDGTVPVGSLTVDPTASLEARQYVRLRVEAPQDGDVELRIQRPDGQVHVTKTLALEDLDGAWEGTTKWFLLPTQRVHGGEAESLGPYRAIVVQGTSANHTTVGPAPAHDIRLEIPDDPDQEPPQWPTDPLWQVGSTPGFSRDGTVQLQWRAASDGGLPNRAVDHYMVFDGSEAIAGPTRATQATLDGLAEGPHTLRIKATDLVRNTLSTDDLNVLVDTRPVGVTFKADTQPSPTGAFAGPVHVTVSAADAGTEPSGLSGFKWRLGDGATTHVDVGACPGLVLVCDNPADFTLALEEDGNHTLHVTAIDRAGNRAETDQTIIIDTKPPVFQAVLLPSLPLGAWHNESPRLGVNVMDAGPSGTDEIRWRLGDGDWQAHPVDETPILDTPGEHVLKVEVRDGAGNQARTQLRYAYDPGPPRLTTEVDGPAGEAGWIVGPAVLRASAEDDASGVRRVEYRVASGAWQVLDERKFTMSGTHKVTVRAVDRAGHEATEALTLHIDLDPPTPPGASWSTTSEGRIRADWSLAPPLDAASGVAAVTIERATLDKIESHRVDPPDAQGYVFAGLPAGEHRFRVVVQDAAGHEAATPWTTVTGGNSTTAEQEIAKVRGMVVLKPSVTMVAHDLVEVRYHVDGILRGAVADAPYAFAWDTETLDNGRHEVRIVAIDAAGIHYEELHTYHIRNGYTAAFVDHVVVASMAVAATVIAVAVSSVGYVRWRRWTT